MSARRSFARRVLFAVGLLLTASFLGLFVMSPAKQPAAARPAAKSSVRLADSSSLASAADIAQGKTLFVENCSTCHGVEANGSARAPNLVGLGGAVYNLWLSSGWMPLKEPTAQPQRKPSIFTSQQIDQISAYIESLGPSTGPGVPYDIDLSNADVAAGFNLFSLSCAPCHTITGAGDALAGGIQAPPLHGLTKTQVWEAIRTGPGNMPRFAPGTISPTQIDDVVAFVTEHIENPYHPGGANLGGVGPVAEGFIGLFLGVGLCMLLALWVGDRTEKDEDEEDGHDAAELGGVAHA